jgi:hypothetical protein
MSSQKLWIIGGALVVAVGAVAYLSNNSVTLGKQAAGTMIKVDRARATMLPVPMQRCTDGFTASATLPENAADNYDILFPNKGVVTEEANYEAGRTTYNLVARDRKTGAIVANGECIVDANDTVVALKINSQGTPGRMLATNEGAK